MAQLQADRCMHAFRRLLQAKLQQRNSTSDIGGLTQHLLVAVATTALRSRCVASGHSDGA